MCEDLKKDRSSQSQVSQKNVTYPSALAQLFYRSNLMQLQKEKDLTLHDSVLEGKSLNPALCSADGAVEELLEC